MDDDEQPLAPPADETPATAPIDLEPRARAERPVVVRSAEAIRKPASRTSAIIAIIPWLILFGVSVVETDWKYFTSWLLAGTIMTFAFYVFDKVFAKTGSSRVPEGILWGMGLFGGVIGGWLGMIVLRHKFAHRSFWAVQILASIIWIAIGVWIFFIR
ncbi:MAG: DUF1294 domain-containing protein [Thermomicrobiales bacterium]